MNDTNHRQWVLDALDQYEGRLLRYAQRLLGELDEARDIVQFVFLKLCDQSETDINNRLPQWLYTVCRNRAMDVLRASGREKANGKSVGWAVPSSETKDGGHSPPYEDDPADLAEQADLHALLRTLIENLPANQREALDLWADGFSYLQIAAITKHSEGHVRVLVHRGLKALREHPTVRSLINDESDRDDDSPVAQRRNHVAVGVSPWETKTQTNESPEGAT
ncbi:MAG TPA: sigma-70 family RNA polymerase sigma factor [Pirellulaceae bacterium]|jgi:RNA polymerase sigma-70 factor (ECF subfamily)